MSQPKLHDIKPHGGGHGPGAGLDTNREENKGKENITSPERRNLFFKLGVAVNVVAGALLTIPLVGFVFASFVERKDPRAWISLGPLDGFPENATRIASYRNPYTRPWDGETANIPCWVRRLQGQKFQIFAVNCTHLGCPVRWFQESGLFMCPCHGGAYYEDGSRAAGPPPRGLFQYDYKVENGELWVKGGEMPTLSNPV
jgi:menaquinol-cytochrome c reductase iron-sulfur subunit